MATSSIIASMGRRRTCRVPTGVVSWRAVVATTMAVVGGGAACGGDGPPAIDAVPSRTITLSLDRTVVTERVSTTPLELAATEPPPTLLDGTPMALREPGVWTAQVPDGTAAAVALTLSGLPRVWDLPGDDLRASLVERATTAVTPPPAGAFLELVVTLPTPYTSAEQLDVVVFGTRFGAEVPGVSPGATGFTRALRYDAPARLTPDAHVTVLRYAVTPDSAALTGALVATAIDQTGVSTTIEGAIDASAPTMVLHAAQDHAAVTARLAALTPPMAPVPGSETGVYQVAVTPGAAAGYWDGVSLAYGRVPTGASLDVSYQDPLSALGWPEVVTIGRAAYRDGPILMGSPARLIASVQMHGTPSAVTSIDYPAGLATHIALDGAPLTADLTPIHAGFEVTFTTDQATPDTLYTLDVINTVGAPGGDSATLEMVSTEPRFVVPASAFPAGRPPWYILRITSTRGGYPRAASGDLTTFALPMSTATVDSPLILIQ